MTKNINTRIVVIKNCSTLPIFEKLIQRNSVFSGSVIITESVIAATSKNTTNLFQLAGLR